MRLSNNFHLHEFTRSQIATRLHIDNTPTPDHIRNLTRLAETILQPLRDALGAVYITSGYRCLDLNDAVVGATHSAHLSGNAADVVVASHTPQEVAEWLEGSDLPYDKIIQEFGEWVHIQASDNPRRKVLTAKRNASGTYYEEGLT